MYFYIQIKFNENLKHKINNGYFTKHKHTDLLLEFDIKKILCLSKVLVKRG